MSLGRRFERNQDNPAVVEGNLKLAEGKHFANGYYAAFNSPEHMTYGDLWPSGLSGVHPFGWYCLSPNGSSLAFQAMSTGAIVVAGCLRNASTVAQWAQSVGRRITVVPAGEQWPDGSLRPAIEDLIGAGAILTRLSGHRSPEANIAAGVFERVEDRLLEQLSLSSSGRELVERGFELMELLTKRSHQTTVFRTR